MKDARCFCKDCEAWICDDCKDSHRDFRDLQKHAIVTKDAVICIESSAPSDISTRLEELSTKPSEDSSVHTDLETKPQVYNEDKPRNLQTKPSEYAASKYLAKPSTDSSTPAAEHKNMDILHYKTTKKIIEIDVNLKMSGDKWKCDITGCCFMPGGELVLCDNSNYKLKLLDRSMSIGYQVDIPAIPYDVAAIDNSNVLVTMPWVKQLQFIHVLPSLKLDRTIDVGQKCWGVDVAVGNIYVSCYDIDETMAEIHVRVYNLEGRDLGKRININPAGSNMFRDPRYVAVSRLGDKIFVSDWTTNIVTCLTSNGRIVYQYRDDLLRGPQGLLVDDNDNFCVCGFDSHTVDVITSSGRKYKTMLSRKDGVSCPRYVCFRPSDGTLVVVGWKYKPLAYKMS